MISAILLAVWLGILTSISPCPLATNIAAVSFIGRKFGQPYWVLVNGVLYMLGRCWFYIATGLVLSLAMDCMPAVADWLQSKMAFIGGPVLILLGLVMLDVFEWGLPKFKLSDGVRNRIERLGSCGAVFLGFLFAAMLCPVSAAFFFSSLIQSEGNVVVLASYGLGTGLPVLVFAVVLAGFAHRLSAAYQMTALFEKWARRLTAVIFIGVGCYYLWTFLAWRLS